MADQVERIILDLDTGAVERGVSSANRSIERLETSARRFNMTPQERIIDRFEALRKTLGGNATALAQVDAAIARTNTQFAAMAEKANAGMSNFGRQVQNFIQNPLQAAGTAAGELATKIGPLGIGLFAGAAGFGAVAAGVFSAVKSLGEYGHTLQDVSIRTGLTKQEVAGFSFAAKMGGTDISAFEMAMRMLSKGLADNSEEGKKAKEGLAELGVTARTSHGQLRPMSDVFVDISHGLNQIEGTANRNAAALKIFGRAGLELVPTMLELESSLKTFQDLGLAPSNESLKQWQEYYKQMVIVEARWDKMIRTAKDLATAFPFWLTVEGFGAGQGVGHPMEFHAATTPTSGRGGFFGMAPGQEEARWQKLIEEQQDKNDFARAEALRESALQPGFSIEGLKEGAKTAGLEAEKARAALMGAPEGTGSEAMLKLIESWRQATTYEKQYQNALEGLQEKQKADAAAEKEIFTQRVKLEEAGHKQRTEQNKENLKAINEEFSKEMEFTAKVEAARQEAGSKAISQSEARFSEIIRMREDAELSSLDRSKDAQIRQLEGVAGDSVREKIGLENQKAAIEEEYLNRSLDKQILILQRRTEVDIQEKQKGLEAGAARDAVRYSMEQEEAAKIAILRGENVDKVAAIEQGKSLQINRILESQNEKSFESMKRGFEGLFDAAFEKGKSFTDALKQMFIASFLTPIKEMMAGLLAGLLTGQGVSGMGGLGGAGGLGGILFGGGRGGGGLFGGGPVNGNPMVLSAMGGGGGGGLIGLLGKIPGLGFLAPGGGPSTSVSLGGYYSGITGAPAPAAASDSGSVDLSGYFSGITGAAGGGGAAPESASGGSSPLLRLLGGGAAMASAAAGGGGGRESAGTIAGHVEPLAQKTASSLIPGGLFGHSGFGTSSAGQAGSGLAFGGGMMLMADTLRRGQGGAGGALEGAAGGAMIGFSVAGPIGAAVGAGVGALIGGFYKGPEQQVIEQVKAKYGLNIERGTAAQIVALAKQKYGGNFAAAIGSPDIQDMLDLVAQATGQNYNNPNKVRPLSVTESGGKLYQNAMYENGRALSFQGSLPTYQGIPTTAIPSSPSGFGNATTVVGHFTLDPDATVQFLSGNTVQTIGKNPRAVAAALNTSLSQNFGRAPLRSAIGATGEILA